MMTVTAAVADHDNTETASGATVSAGSWWWYTNCWILTANFNC